MAELLFIIGILGLALVQLGERLAALPGFPSILFVSLATPFLFIIDYERTRLALKEYVFGDNEAPVPPERFYWPARRRSLLWQILVLPCLSLGGWVLMFHFPTFPDPVNLLPSIWNWLGTVVALVSTGPALARFSLYVRVSRRFKRAGSSFSRFMYWISDNPDYLEEDENSERQRRERSLY